MATLDPDESRRRFATRPVAVLGTHGEHGAIHLVPVTFGLVGDTIATAVDHKPKRTTQLQRLFDIERDPHVSLLVERYADDWEQLWWVRAEGTASVVESSAGLAGIAAAAFGDLTGRYRPYDDRPPAGPVIVVTVTRWTGWSWARAARSR